MLWPGVTGAVEEDLGINRTVTELYCIRGKSSKQCPGGGHSGNPSSKPHFSPPCADHKAFYVIFTWDHEAQIYELVAQTSSERKK